MMTSKNGQHHREESIMPAKVFLVDVPSAFTILALRRWLNRFWISSISSIRSPEGLCVQIETDALPEANKIACTLESVYLGNGPLNVIRGDTDEGHALTQIFAECRDSMDPVTGHAKPSHPMTGALK
jgi:hypothetical protein